jgi:hypothetical protein
VIPVQRLRLHRCQTRGALGPYQADVGVRVGRDDLRIPRAPLAHLNLIEGHRLHRPRRQGGGGGHQIGAGLAPVGGGAVVSGALDFPNTRAVDAIDIAGDLAYVGDPQRAHQAADPDPPACGDQPTRGRRRHRLLAQSPVTHGWDAGDGARLTAACGGGFYGMR